jgi:hypothetical protein
MRSHAARRACDWDFAARLEPQACRIAEVAGPVDESAPWRLLFLAGASAAQQLATARRSAQRIADTLPHQVSVSRTAMRERIRIGFFSGDF